MIQGQGVGITDYCFDHRCQILDRYLPTTNDVEELNLFTISYEENQDVGRVIHVYEKGGGRKPRVIRLQSLISRSYTQDLHKKLSASIKSVETRSPPLRRWWE